MPVREADRRVPPTTRSPCPRPRPTRPPRSPRRTCGRWGVEPPLERQPDFPREVLGACDGRLLRRPRRMPDPPSPRPGRLRRLPLHVPDRQHPDGPVARTSPPSGSRRAMPPTRCGSSLDRIRLDDCFDRASGRSCSRSSRSSPDGDAAPDAGRLRRERAVADRPQPAQLRHATLVRARRRHRRQPAHRTRTPILRRPPRAQSVGSRAAAGQAARARSRSIRPTTTSSRR